LSGKEFHKDDAVTANARFARCLNNVCNNTVGVIMVRTSDS